MTVTLFAESSPPKDLGAVGIGVFADFSTTCIGGNGIDRERCERRGFMARPGDALVEGTVGGPIEVLVGLGVRGAGWEQWRRAGAALVRATSGIDRVALDCSSIDTTELDPTAMAQAIGEGALLASYRFTAYKSDVADEATEHLLVVGPEVRRLASGLERAGVIAGAVELARDLVNTPATELTPTRFAELAGDVAAREELGFEAFGTEEITEMKLGGLLGVARGSAEAPRIVRIVYDPARRRSTPTVVLVGKGITFDSGGLSLKSAEGMETMKTDMSGAAAVLATLGACRRLKIPVRVIGLMPLSENMPGGRAIKPGDVLRTRNGKTIEVLNTDAEGRLVLADALALAAEEEPDAIIDLATLTGACIMALGDRIAGLMGNDDRLAGAVAVAASAAGEATWPLPLPIAYRPDIDSDVADMKNIGVRGKAGALAAGLLLEEFVGTVPWAHLDIAGPARSNLDTGYLRKGATGFGVRTLLELLGSYARLGGVAAGSSGKEVLW